MTLTKRFDDAVLYAHEAHGDQTRKGTYAPYLGHLLGVASIVQAWPTAEIIATDVTAAHLRGRSMKAYPKGAPDAALQAAFDQRLDGAETSLRDALAKPDLSTREREGFQASQRLLAQYREDTRNLVLALPTRTFVESLKLDDATHPVELRHPGRGNTDGDLIAWLPRQRVMATGDLLVAPVPFGFNAYPAQWQAALRAMQAQRAGLPLPTPPLTDTVAAATAVRVAGHYSGGPRNVELRRRGSRHGRVSPKSRPLDHSLV